MTTTPHNKKHPINVDTPDHLNNNAPQYTVHHTIGQKKCPATSTAHTITHIAENSTPVLAGVKRLHPDTDSTHLTPPTTTNLAKSIDILYQNIATATNIYCHSDQTMNDRINKAFQTINKNQSTL
jgi:predicted lipoprotein